MPNESLFYQCVVIDNNDPLMLGRVRAKINIVNYPDIIKSIENWDPINDPWTERDPLIFYPLLPYFLYQVPKVNELIQVMFTNSEFKYQNQYYIQSNFFSVNSAFNTNNNGGAKFTGTGMQFRPPRNIKNKDGTWPSNTVEKGLYPEPGDNAVLGRGSADMIVKNTDLVLRAGKFKEQPQSNTIVAPNNNRAFLQLSLFDKTKTGESKKQIINTVQITLLINYLIEWVIINPENRADRFTGSIYLYSLKPSVSHNTDNFKIDTVVPAGEKFLIDTESFTALSMQDTIALINRYIKTCNDSNISINGTTLFTESINKFPIFFRPTVEMYSIISPSTQITNSNITAKQNLTTIYQAIKLNNTDPGGFGLIWKKGTVGLPTKVEIQNVIKEEYKYEPTTIAALGGQKIYLLSQNSQIDGKRKINFADSIYGITEEGFTKDIQPNTSSMVRGEELLELINLLYQFLVSHTHAYPGLTPVSKTQAGVQVEDLDVAMRNAITKILNSNIRLN